MGLPYSIPVGVLVRSEKKLKKGRIGLAMETVVEMVIGKDSRNENGNRKECSGLSEIEA